MKWEWLGIGIMAGGLAMASDFDFDEEFADPATRESALERLVPGTRNDYFYHALHQQLTGDLQAFQKTLTAWREAATRSKDPISEEGLRSLETRQHLLSFEDDPEASLAGLMEKWDLHFDDEKPDASELEKLPTTLDPTLISEEAFEQAAHQSKPDEPWRAYRQERLAASLDDVTKLSAAQVRFTLETLTRADLPGVVELVLRGLQQDPPVPFNSVPLHRQLTLEQIKELTHRMPSLRIDPEVVSLSLKKLRSDPDETFARSPQLHLAHLRKLRQATAELPSAFAPLKAHILFHLLQLEFAHGEPSLDEFLAYLAFPRRSHELILRSTQAIVPNLPLDSDFREISGCPPIQNDSKFVRQLLIDFLKDPALLDRFAPLIERGPLLEIRAEAQLLAGADPSLWGPQLSASRFAQLRSETRIQFGPKRPLLLAADAPVAIALDLKNTPELTVHIHDLDLPSLLRREGHEPEADLDLAGLVPHHTRTLRFSQPPLVLHRETLDLPELTGPGAWIVELVSQGQASRILVRKGQLIPDLTRSALGQQLRAFDENGSPLKNLTLNFQASTFTSDEGGKIEIPGHATTTGGRALLVHGPLATWVTLEDFTDDFDLRARVHLDREQLRADALATARIELTLTHLDQSLPLESLQNPRLTLSAELVSGMTTEHVIADDLHVAPVMMVPFQVPADAVRLTLRLDATVSPRATSDPVPVSCSETISFNSLLSGDFAHAHFSLTSRGTIFELLGRNGEPLAGRSVQFHLFHEGFENSLTVRLRTDAQGKILLGELDSIRDLNAFFGIPSLTSMEAKDIHPRANLPAMVRITPAETLRLPLTGPLDRLHYGLTRSNLFGDPVHDHFEQLQENDHQLTLTGLPVGNYRLTTPHATVEIEIIDAPLTEGRFVAPNRIASHLPAEATAWVAHTIENDTLKLQFRSPHPDTLVHLIGTRFIDTLGDDHALSPFASPPGPTVTPSFTGCGYLTNRTLDEETRYILDRRSSPALPGTLLPRPGWLAHRWGEEDSSGAILPPLPETEGSLEQPSSPRSSSPETSHPFSDHSRKGGHDATPDAVDYLAHSSILLYDLTPDENGLLSVPLSALGNSQSIRVVVSSPGVLERRILPLTETPAELRDRRLSQPLDATRHHVTIRRAVALSPGAEATIDTTIDADWRSFNTLADAHNYLYGATYSDSLRELAGMLDWPSFDEPAKLNFWAHHACHELHLFLSRRDPEFFEKYIKPTLAQKLEPTFIDDYLLGRDLTAYLRPFAWRRLNAAEKALLVHALPAARDRILDQLEDCWELEAPNPEQENQRFAQILRGTDLASIDSLGIARNEAEEAKSAFTVKSSGASFIQMKMRKIIIPTIDFEDISVSDAIEFLRMRSIEFDTVELDPQKKGIKIVVRGPFQSQRIQELRLRNVPLAEALNYICEATRLRWSIDDFAVTIKPATEVGEDLFTRSYKVPPNFISVLNAANDRFAADGDSDPFASNEMLPAPRRQSLVELLKSQGIKFRAGASAQFFAEAGTLLIRNTPTNLEFMDSLIRSLSDEGDDFQHNVGDLGLTPEVALRPPLRRGSAARPLTRIWMESNYDHHPSKDTSETMIPLNAFWLDFARWDGSGPFLSPHFHACTASPNAALMALAVLDLPFKAQAPEIIRDDTTLHVAAVTSMLLFFKDTRETDQFADDSPVLVRETFHRLNEHFVNEDSSEVEKSVKGPFLTGVPYGASLVVTNPTGDARRIEVLAQIPAGSIALRGKDATLSTVHKLKPYEVLKFDLAFYFPSPGEFTAYPLHISSGETILASAATKTFQVVDTLPTENGDSWPVLARDGSSAQVLERLRTVNLQKVNLDLLAWRCRDRDFYEPALSILRERLVLPSSLARYAFLHQDRETLHDWLETSPELHQLGEFLDSPLLRIEPFIHGDWANLEFDPLIHSRSHRLSNRPWFSQEALQKHYQDFLRQLAWKPILSADDQLHLTGFLFLQDRVTDALERLEKVDRDQVSSTIAYDYLKSLALFHQGKPEDAATLARSHADAPPGPWSDRFQSVISQAEEIAELTRAPLTSGPDPSQVPATHLDLALAKHGQLQITQRGLKQVDLSLYQVDLEMLFSRNPFLQDSGKLPGTQPNLVENVPLAEEQTLVDLPAPYQQGNVLVVADAGAIKTLRVLNSHALQVTCTRNHPILQVRQAETGSPISAAYVKVYTERDGQPAFLKDGYTDLRGMFDYRTLTDDAPIPSGRIAILVTHPDHGSLTLVLE
ncbi:hypothetical protein HNR46_001953 [Haloferula luteola]|uniref:Uncharacterized protein n=1 Tax=Haloferula luteola TaxID=595692 RepID=A0A840V7Z8_9BACT|nr:hypothetical protein [Haloferula luteola]MBB5351714.1 hypothetical protein [Haloferula luteola]